MKAEDIARVWDAMKHPGDPYNMPEWGLQSSNGRKLLERFARACEQHGIERAKAKSTWYHGVSLVDFPELDAEIAKENEDG